MSLLALVPSALLLLSTQSPPSPVSYSPSSSTSPSPSSSRVHHHSHNPKAMSFESLEGNRRRGRKKQTTKAVFSCRYCGKGFPRNEHMLRHERKHTGEKPFACLFDGCNKTFSRYDNMMPHFRHHFGYSRNQEAAERAEREIPLLRENTVDELKRMSREKNPAGASPVAVVTSPTSKAQNHRAPPSPAASSCSAHSDSSSLNHGESEMDFSDEGEDEEEISAGDTEEIEEEALGTTSADLGSKMQFLAVAAAMGAAPSPASAFEAPQSSGSAQQLLLGNQQLSSSSSSLSTPSTSSSPVFPLLLPFSPVAGSMTTAGSYQARPSVLLGLHQPAFVPNVQQFDRELLSKFKGPL